MSVGGMSAVHWVCVGLAAIATGAAVHRLWSCPPEGAVRRLRAYEGSLQRRLAFLRLPWRGRHVVLAQAACIVAACVFTLWGAVAVGAVLAGLPWLVDPLLEGRSNERLAQLDLQLEAWLRALAGGLSSGASLGQAIGESVGLVETPLREEVELVCGDMALGVSVHEALGRMGRRVQSATLSTALAAVRIGQCSGGSVPTMLMESAAALREMARLEGVVRTRTAESRAQAAVVGGIPIPMVGFIHHLNPALMSPLWKNDNGWIVVALATGFWVLSILVARRILDVDI